MSTEKKDDKCRITMTLPAAVIAAMNAAGQELQMDASEWGKHQFMVAYSAPGGVHMKLERVVRDKAAGHPELSLEGSTWGAKP